MDADEVEAVAGQLHTQSGNLQNAMTQITNLVNKAVQVWDGQDSKQFQDAWISQHQPGLKRAAEAIEQLSQAAKTNAARQREVSNS